MYKDYQNQVSLRGFSKLTDTPRWRLRYYLARASKRQAREKKLTEEQEWVQELALKHKTYGYRRIYQEANKLIQMGREKVRQHMKTLDLQRVLAKKKRKTSPEVSRVCDLPEGRKLQIDATRFQLKAEIAWKYLVEDVSSRTCLALHTVKRLSQEAASSALVMAQTKLEKLGITEPLIIQSDGGSDFTSQFFQDTCTSLNASWHRSKVSEKGGMAILERLNRTLKYDFVFWHEPESLEDLAKLDQEFEHWYNHERIHSSIDYLTPWQKLSQDATLSSSLG